MCRLIGNGHQADDPLNGLRREGQMSIFSFNGMNTGGSVGGYTGVAASQNAGMLQKAGASSESPESVLKPGSVISGEIAEVNEDSVKLKLSGDRFINARLDTQVNVEPGQSMSFQVTGEISQPELRPLYANLTASAAAEAALDQAGLPATGPNINMVNTMMEQGMPVNREALRAMARLASLHPAQNPSTVVELTKLGVPVTESNINQLENYKSFEHQIINDAETMSEGMGELLGEVSEELTGEILSLVSGESGEAQELIDLLKAAFPGEAAAEPEAGGALADGVPSQAAAGTEPEIAGAGKKLIIDGALADGEGFDIATDGEKNPGTQAEAGLKAQGESPARAQSDISAAGQEVSVKEGDRAFETVLKELSERLKEAGASQEEITLLSENRLPGDRLVNLTAGLYEQLSSGQIKYDPLKQTLEKLFKTDGFKDTAKNELMKKLTLKPGEVADKEKVEELYKRLNEQSEKAAEILRKAGKADTPAMQSAQSLKENVRFMNDLNQMMQYVQLPLKMARENTHGDLYVYTKNKKQLGKDGKVSALLHLDMETLGPMDVYVAMQTDTGRVNTHFYLRDEETLDFIMANIDKLDKRLSDKGYNMHTTVTTRDIKEDKGIVDAFLTTAAGEGTSNSRVSKYSFDVRA